jgi:hypothetical protein
MPAPTTLSAAEIEHFHIHGYAVVRGAFARDDALAMQDEWWAELRDVHGIAREDRATWRQVPGDLKRPKTAASQRAIATARVRGVIDDLLGAGAWDPPRDWGRPLATFPHGTERWDVPVGLWHWDSPLDWHAEGLEALFVVSFVGAVAPRGGGTLILAGSPRLLARHEATLTPAERSLGFARRRELFHRAHPWLMALTGKAPSPPDRVASFMDTPTDVDGVRAQVIELTGAPGDMVVCHPAMVHCIAPNRGATPRFMRIKQQLMTRAGQARVHRAMHPR